MRKDRNAKEETRELNTRNENAALIGTELTHLVVTTVQYDNVGELTIREAHGGVRRSFGLKQQQSETRRRSLGSIGEHQAQEQEAMTLPPGDRGKMFRRSIGNVAPRRSSAIISGSSKELAALSERMRRKTDTLIHPALRIMSGKKSSARARAKETFGSTPGKFTSDTIVATGSNTANAIKAFNVHEDNSGLDSGPREPQVGVETVTSTSFRARPGPLTHAVRKLSQNCKASNVSLEKFEAEAVRTPELVSRGLARIAPDPGLDSKDHQGAEAT